MAGSYELYAEVLRRAAVTVAEEIGWTLEPSRAQFLPDSVAYWHPFREANAAMDRLKERYEIGIVSNIDDKLLGISRRHLRTELDLVVTAQQVRTYKPDDTHFRECARRIGGKKGWVHIASGYDDRRRALPEDERPGDLGQPPRREARAAARPPTRPSRTSATRRRSSARSSARYSIFASRSPALTAAPSVDGELGDLARLVGGDLVLHLHRLDHADEVALGDLLALLDRDLEDVALKRGDERVAGGGAAAAGLALALRRLLQPGRRRRPRSAAGAASPITLTSKSLPPTSTW